MRGKSESDHSAGLPITLKCPVSGNPVLEKQSRFLACGVPVEADSDPASAVRTLTDMFRLEKASHLSWALRRHGCIEGRGDGGESGAGNCILEVMRNMNAVDCIVLVARWYGGKHLGGMRFRIYRDTAAELLREHGITCPPR